MALKNKGTFIITKGLSTSYLGELIVYLMKSYYSTIKLILYYIRERKKLNILSYVLNISTVKV